MTLQKRGTLTFNHNAYKLMGEPDAIQLLFDPDAQVIGVKPCAADAPSSFPLRDQSRKEQATKAVPSTGFVQHFGIDTSVSRRYSPTWRDGMLLINLADGGTEVVRVRGAREPHEGTSDAPNPDLDD